MMKSLSYSIVAALLALGPHGLASPTSQSSGKGSSQVATFEEFFTTPATSQTTVPDNYKNVGWDSFAATSDGPLPAIVSNTPFKRAVVSVRSQILGGSPGRIFTTFPGSQTRAFNLVSLYFGCGADLQSAVTTAIACTIKVTGKRADTGALVGPRLIYFNPSSLVQAPMQLATFSDMNNMQEAVFEVDTSSIPIASQLTTVVWYDTMKFTTFSK